MKRYLHLIILATGLISLNPLNAQELNAKFDEAEKAYQAKNLDDTRFALQGALHEINVATGKEILQSLPEKLGEMAFVASEDRTGGVAGFAGLSVSRHYMKDTLMDARVEILGDSPLLTSLNALLSMPAVMSAGDPNQKRIKIAGYKALIQKESSDAKPRYTVQIPLEQTLVTLTCEGNVDENLVVSMANALPLEKIAIMSK